MAGRGGMLGAHQRGKERRKNKKQSIKGQAEAAMKVKENAAAAKVRYVSVLATKPKFMTDKPAVKETVKLPSTKLYPEFKKDHPMPLVETFSQQSEQSTCNTTEKSMSFFEFDANGQLKNNA